jgi:hypothetical protein
VLSSGGDRQKLLSDRYKKELANPRVELPRKTLAPDSYNFTLCVTKGDDSACDSTTVQVVAGRVATFQLATRDTVVVPNKKIQVKGGSFTGHLPVIYRSFTIHRNLPILILMKLY